jgi:hypothetical protein
MRVEVQNRSRTGDGVGRSTAGHGPGVAHFCWRRLCVEDVLP